MEKIKLEDLSSTDKKALIKEAQAQLAAEKAAKAAEIETYKKLIDETILSAFPRLSTVSERLAAEKAEIRKMFSDALRMKSDIFSVEEDQRSHTFTTSDSKFRIEVGYYINDRFDDTADSGVALVKEYLMSLKESARSGIAVDICLGLLAKDNKGTLKASKILTLRKRAIESGDEKFINGVDIIMNAYRPERSKEYIKASYKDNLGQWQNLPLGMTEA